MSMKNELVVDAISRVLEELEGSACDMWCITPQEVGVESFTDADADSLALTYKIAAEEIGADPWNDDLPADHPDKIVPPIGFVKGGKVWIEVVAQPGDTKESLAEGVWEGAE